MQKEARKTSPVQPWTPCKPRSGEQGCQKDDDDAVMQQYRKTAEQKQLRQTAQVQKYKGRHHAVEYALRSSQIQHRG
jgi:hypothetical protein